MRQMFHNASKVEEINRWTEMLDTQAGSSDANSRFLLVDEEIKTFSIYSKQQAHTSMVGTGQGSTLHINTAIPVVFPCDSCQIPALFPCSTRGEMLYQCKRHHKRGEFDATMTNDWSPKRLGENLSEESKRMTYQIYALEHPVEHKMRYVGLSRDARKRFIPHTTPSKARQWIKDLLSQGLRPILHIIETDIPDLNTARTREKYWISYYEGQNHPLKNLYGNWLAQYSRDEEEALFNHVYAQFAKVYHEDVASELTQMTLIGYEKVGHDAWDTNFDAVVGTLKILHEKYGLDVDLSVIDAAKITFSLFGYEYGSEEVER